MVWPFRERQSSESAGWYTEDEYHEDPVPDLCLAGLSVDPPTPTAGGPTRPPDVLLPLTDPDWQPSALNAKHPLHEAAMSAVSPTDSGLGDGFAALSLEEQEKLRQEWREELAKVEEDIVLMRETLAAKMRESQELKQKLGISVWTEFTGDVNLGLKNVRESQAYTSVSESFTELHQAVTSAPLYQKTGAALKTTGEKATGLLAGLGAKLSEARESTAFKSVEERVGSMVTSVKSKVGNSRSNSTQSFDEALKEAEAAKKQQAAAEEMQQQ